jgi:hypothetical protein
MDSIMNHSYVPPRRKVYAGRFHEFIDETFLPICVGAACSMAIVILFSRAPFFR